MLSSIRLKLALTRNDLLTSKIDTCQFKIKKELNFYFLVLSVINLIELPNTKAKLIRIVIFSSLKNDGWYINLSSMDD